MTQQAVCGATIEGPRVPGTRSARMWRRTCRARPMRDRAELVGFVRGRCFQHQPDEVRNAIHRLRRAEKDAR